MSATTRDIRDQSTMSGLKGVARIDGGNAAFLASKYTEPPVVRTLEHTRCEALWRLAHSLLGLAFPNKASVESFSCCFQQRSWLLAIKVCYKTRKADFDVFQHRVVSPGVPLLVQRELAVHQDVVQRD